MNVIVNLPDGSTETVDIDLGTLTLQESCRVEDALGPDKFDRYLDNLSRGVMWPSAVRAIVWAKLVADMPDLAIDSFDIDTDDDEEEAQSANPTEDA